MEMPMLAPWYFCPRVFSNEYPAENFGNLIALFNFTSFLLTSICCFTYCSNGFFCSADKYHSSKSAERIRKLIVDANGRKVSLENIANVVSSMGPNTISRENVARKLVISANVADRDLRGVVNDIQKKVDSEIQLPEGYHLEYGGQFESEQAASRIITITSVFSILVIFLLLFKEFKSTTQSLVILLNLPLALIGGVFSIY
jgi:Cu/Ag efflux pump CusA